ncbi:RNA polymerase sigma factor [Candidatus Chrysopegis kryptomonas]|jgi:RNA polymerase sigma-70 factor (ECF subfamily)|uniref:RNA polymerase sigma-70 factor, ECF subfamily n=1 Tax=Candidatus Chryseopegocella kryptomonas TaxID=1633643 RepID=A0A0P1MZZ8_9BACT|nr:RNA polymerase sigma factor [Candidatus Chrysopegis kryptomonas]CUT01678.1 RNA polymerase sigma-70 factor, ECF subfamily [Candidatus Chrysopegis kryptomonas]
MDSDREILERIKNGEISAFEEIYEKYKNQLYRFCFRMISDKETALDIVQDVFLKLYENINSIEPNSSLSALLFKMARNKCLNFIRDKKEKIDTEQIEINSNFEIEKEFEIKETKERLMKVLDLIGDEYREILILREWNGLSYADIAEVLNTTIPAVKSKLFKARKKLTEIYKKLYGDEEK